MFPSFRNNDLVSYSAHEFAFRMNLIICIDIMASNQFSTKNGMVSCFALLISSFCLASFRYFVFSPGVFSLFRLFAWRLFVISSFRLASFRYFVFSLGVFSLFRLFAWRLFVISSFRVAFFRLFVFSLGVLAGRKDEITPGEKTK